MAVARLNLSPPFMRELIEAMQDNFAKWQAREMIKRLPEVEGPGDPGRSA